MFGPPGELRCEGCVAKRRRVYEAPRVRWKVAAQPFVTYALMAVSTVFTLAYWENLPFAAWLIVDLPKVWDGELWRLATAALLHGRWNWLHIAFNLYWVYIFGAAIEAWLRHGRFLAFTVLLALGSTAAEFLVGHTVVGLSGVVYGYFGLLFALRRHKAFAAELLQPSVVQTMFGWFLLCIVGGMMDVPQLNRVANLAHGVGLALGYAVGWAVVQPKRNYYLTGVAVVVAGSMGFCMYMPWDVRFVEYRFLQRLNAGDKAGAERWIRALMENSRRKALQDRFAAPARDAAEGDFEPDQADRANRNRLDPPPEVSP
ncbi:MAG: rhomboid family intramembrane serine protease [Planctomycetia bacterium]